MDMAFINLHSDNTEKTRKGPTLKITDNKNRLLYKSYDVPNIRAPLMP